MRAAFTALIAALVTTVFATPAAAITKIQSLCTVAGQSELTLRGHGLVVGLSGTGDTDGDAVTKKAVTAYLQKFGQQATADELKKVSNYAVVEITATVSHRGIARGQKLDCYVSALGGVKSLVGGRLVLAGLALHNDRDTNGELLVSATAGGEVIVEDLVTPTSGRIPGGVVMARTIGTSTDQAPPMIELLIKRQHANWKMAHNVQKAINDQFSLQGKIAKAQSQFLITVQVPAPYVDDHVQFVAELMGVSVLETGAHPRVLINAKQGSVVLTGTVSISPVAFMHRNVNVEIGGPFIAVEGDQGGGSTQQLNDLLTALNQLKVPADDVVAIVRQLNELGILHAEVIEN